jgi:hypothetical protein
MVGTSPTGWASLRRAKRSSGIEVTVSIVGGGKRIKSREKRVEKREERVVRKE